MQFGPGQRIVFIGDSITDSERLRDVPPYGNGYMSLVRAFVTARHPELGLTWYNSGISGNTVRDLDGRWESDAVGLKPDWLSVMIGINDIWRAFEGRGAEAVPIDEYSETLHRLLKRAVEATGCRLILADPYLIEADQAEPQLVQTRRYCEVVARLAEEFGALHVRSQEAFDRVLATTKSQDWAHDRIHPNLPGHAVLAQAFLDVLE
jgi:lysophospholipase L1-like esterase